MEEWCGERNETREQCETMTICMIETTICDSLSFCIGI